MNGNETESPAPRRRLWRAVRMIFLVAIVVYLSLMAAAWFLSEKLIFQPQPASYRQDAQLVTIPADDGGTIALRYRETKDARYTVLYSHGNAEDIGDLETAWSALNSAGLSVLFYDYRGYGQSSGNSSESATEYDIAAAHRWLTEERGVDPKRLILYGRSVGGGPTLYLAGRVAHAGLILESAFTSAFRVMIPWRIFPVDRFPNQARLTALATKNPRLPTLVIHGRKDRVIAFWHGEALFAAAPALGRQQLWLDEAGHNNVLLRARKLYVEKVKSFVSGLEKAASDR